MSPYALSVVCFSRHKTSNRVNQSHTVKQTPRNQPSNPTTTHSGHKYYALFIQHNRTGNQHGVENVHKYICNNKISEDVVESFRDVLQFLFLTCQTDEL